MASSHLLFDKTHRESIKSLMNWDEDKYNMFCDQWTFTLSTVFCERKNVIYSENYFSNLLDLFFTRIQLDVTDSIQNKKSVLLCLLTFYLFSDSELSALSEEHFDSLLMFYNFLLSQNLISIPCIKNSTSLLSFFIKSDTLHVGDSSHNSSYNLLTDLLSFTDPVSVGPHYVILFEKPDQTIFLVKKPYPNHEHVFDAIFQRSLKIKDSFLKSIYMSRLHSIMETQYKKSIFPF